MLPRSRRDFLRHSAVALSALGAGCFASNGDEFPPDVDESVDENHELVAVSASGGTVRRSNDTVARQETLVGGVLYAAEDGTVYAFDAVDLVELWSIQTEQVQISDTVGRRIYHVTPPMVRST